MKRVDLPISRLSLAQKLESPAWHQTILEDREKALEAGEICTSDWEQAKKRIREHVS